ncbi:hypothetical protein [Bilophila sp.]|uniref:hypothetical protein n=1 Tax=Bilophila sp. TaxID=1929485 RepID=UPI003076C07B
MMKLSAFSPVFRRWAPCLGHFLVTPLELQERKRQPFPMAMTQPFILGLQSVEDTKWSKQESIRYTGDFDYGCATERIDVLRFQRDNQQDTSAMEPVNGKMG